MLGNATYNNDAAAVRTGSTTPAGTVTYTSPTLAWTGTIPASRSVTLSYTVTVQQPGYRQQDPGQHRDLHQHRQQLPGPGGPTRLRRHRTVSALIIDFTASTTPPRPAPW